MIALLPATPVEPVGPVDPVGPVGPVGPVAPCILRKPEHNTNVPAFMNFDYVHELD